MYCNAPKVVPVLLLLLLLGEAAATSQNATLEILPRASFPAAKCLDGSPFGVYRAPAAAGATAEEKSTWVVLLNGGGLCTSASDCLGRAKTSLGSSTRFAPVFDVNSISLLSSDPRNPFRNAHRVFVPYCTGDMHAGRRTAPGADNATWGLYFSGYHNIQATVQYLSNTYGMNTTGNTLVWSGGSAGGVGVFSTLDLVAASIPEVRVVGAPVGGFPPEVFWSTIKGSSSPAADVRDPAFKVNNELYDAVLPPTCAKALGPARSYQCGIPHVAYPYLQTPVFIIQAKTDVVVTCDFEGMPCKPVAKALFNPDNWHRWDEFGNNATNMLAETVMKSGRDGVFAASCLLHTGFTLDGPLIDSQNAVEALHAWLYRNTTTITSGSDNSDKHEDVCDNNKYWPPCGEKCPPIWKPVGVVGGGDMMAMP